MVIKKCVYSVYRITFDGPGLWSFDNGIAGNVKIVGIDNNSSSHADDHKKNFLVLGEETTFGIMEDLIHQKKKLILILVKQTQNFAWVDITMLIIVVCLLMEKKYLNLKPTIKMLTLQLNFAFEAYLMDLVLLSLEQYL